MLRKLFVITALLILSGLLIPFAGFLNLESKTLANGAQYQVVDCWFETPFWSRVECAQVTPRHPSEAKVKWQIPVVILRRSWWQNDQQPILYLSGGPGGPNWIDSESMSYWMQFFSDSNWGHDLILFDSRGVGESKPRIQCNEVLETEKQTLSLALSVEEEAKKTFEAFQSCYKRLSQSIDFTQLTIKQSTHDVVDIINLTETNRAHLYGVSYGTRLAMEVTRRHPSHVASLILDSVFPPSYDARLVEAEIWVKAIQRVLESCEEMAFCDLQYPNLREKLQLVLNHLAWQPANVELEYEGKALPLTLTPVRFFDTLFFATYSASLIPQIPIAIDELWSGKEHQAVTTLLANYVELVLDPTFSYPVYISSVCNESTAREEAIHEQNRLWLSDWPTLDNAARSWLDYDVCRSWRSGKVGPDFAKPFDTDKPVLILAGQLDGVTPASWGRALSARLPNSTYLELPLTGHSVATSQYCVDQVIAAFFNEDADLLRTACTQAGEWFLDPINDWKYQMDDFVD